MQTRNKAVGLLLAGSGLMALNTLASAQTLPTPTPGNVFQQTQPLPVLPAAPAAPIALPAPAQQAAASALSLAVSRFRLQGNLAFSAEILEPLLTEFQGKTLTLGQLQQAAQRITDYYRQHDYPLAYAYLPAQTPDKGEVILQIVEPRFDQIQLNNTSRLDSEQARRTLGLQSGEPITDSALQRALLLLNRTPGIQVAGTLIPGATPGSTSLQAKITDTPLLRGGFGLDNYGSPYTGRARAQGNLAVDNPFGRGSSLAINALSTQGGLLHAGGFNFLSPDLYKGSRLGFYGSTVRYTLGKQFAALGQKGEADQYGLSLNAPLILSAGKLLEGRLDVLHNRFEQNPGMAYQLNAARFTLSGALADPYGSTSGGVTLTHGKHDNPANPLAKRHFWITQFQVQRLQALPSDFKLVASLNGQLASTALDGSQQFYLGGANGVMSYDNGSLGGDEALLLNLGLFHDLNLGQPGKLSAGLVLQSGKIHQKTRLPAATSSGNETASSLGVEVRYQFTSRIRAQLDFARRIGSRPNLPAQNRDSTLWASVQFDF